MNAVYMLLFAIATGVAVGAWVYLIHAVVQFLEREKR